MTLAADAIDGVTPEAETAPATAAAVAQVLAEASRDGCPTIIRGGGSKIAWGRRPSRVGLVVRMTELCQVLSHRHGDLIATVEGGAAIADVNRELGRHNQWLPMDAPEGATIGGVLSTNDSGPLRHRYGTPRDLLLGVTLALTNGTVVKAGGQVVKNVAGYDIGKLVCGAHGGLAAIVSATFKLVPRVLSSKTLVARFDDPHTAAEAIAAVSASQLEPLSFDLGAGADLDGGFELYVRFASTPGAVDTQIAHLERICSKAACRVAETDLETGIWSAQMGRVWTGAGAVVRLGWLPSNGGRVMALVSELGGAEHGRMSLVGRAAVGAGFVRIEGDASAQSRVISRLRASDLVKHVVVLRASPEVKSGLDVWGHLGDAAEVTRKLKHAFDPNGILNAGRGPA